MFNEERIEKIVGKLHMRGSTICGPNGDQIEQIKRDYQKGLALIIDSVSSDPILDGKMYYIEDDRVMYQVPSLMGDDYVALEFRIPPGSQPQLKVTNNDHIGLAYSLKKELYDKAELDCFILD